MQQAIRDFVRGDGPDVFDGFRRGDSWVQILGPHSQCEQKIVVVGPGITKDANDKVAHGLLVRCGDCLFSFVIL